MESEAAIVKKITSQSVGDKLDVSGIEKVLDNDSVLKLQKVTAALKTDEAIIDYAVKIVRATREWSGIDIGAGPRGSLALLRAAKGNALLNGNSFVTPDDIKVIAPAVLRHRVKLTTDLEIEGYQPDDVLKDILDSVEAPRL